MTRAPAVALAALIAVSCAEPLLKLPTGPGVPAVGAERALTEAAAQCRHVSTISAEVALAGSVSGRRISRGRLILALAAPASARIEAPVPLGAPAFIFVARDGDATLLLERDNRVLEHGRPDAVLEALTGVPLDAAGLLETLTGCPTEADSREARQVGDDWIVMPDRAGQVYLNRRGPRGPWQIAAAVHVDSAGAQWRVEYGAVEDGLARSIHLVASDPGRFDLRLTLSQVDINTSLDADVFRVKIPTSAVPIDVRELRASGPLGGDTKPSGR